MKTPLAPVPPMGWNSWNTFGWNISDGLIREYLPKPEVVEFDNT